jgi:hypothetical protein
VQSLVLERQLAFVDDEPGVELAGGNGPDDLVERYDLVLEAVPGTAMRQRDNSSMVMSWRATTIGP